MKTLILTALLAFTAATFAATTIGDPNKYAWGANIGWINWRDANGGADGAVIGEYVCSGYLWGANVGWIHLGDGTPAGGVQYSNTTGADFGVNHDGTGLLRGLAYGANIGWINFEPTGNPRFDGITGRFSGYAWSANCGWINLGDATFFVQTGTVTKGADSDSDGMSDAWELGKAGDLTTLTAVGDVDGDGESDLAEYLADTGPLDVNDALRILGFAPTPDGLRLTLTWSSRPTRYYRLESTVDLTVGFRLALDNIVPDGTSTVLVLARAPEETQRFYRVQAFRPLSP